MILLRKPPRTIRNEAAMDPEVRNTMGYSEGEAKTVISELYPIIADELTQMKTAMSGR